VVGYLIEKTGAGLATNIIAVSAQTYARLREAGISDRKVHLIPNGTIQMTDMDEKSGARGGMVSFGRLIEHKRVDVAIRVLEELHSRGILETLTIIGDGPERKNLENLAEQLGVSEHVNFLGGLTEQEDVWEIVGRAAVCVMPSEREGYGIAVAEALALGTPVVVGDGEENASRLLVADGVNGRVCTGGSVPEFTKGVLEARNYPNSTVRESFYQQHGGQGWDEAAKKQLGVYENLINRRATK
jgi:glycosyltransferase involved in cell wall biosynthesis